MELKRCPFCGSGDVSVEHSAGDGYYFIWCNGSCQSSILSDCNRDNVINMWNKRYELR